MTILSAPDDGEEPVLVLLEDAPLVQLTLELVGPDLAGAYLPEQLLDAVPRPDRDAAMAHVEQAPRAKLGDIALDGAAGNLVDEL